MDLSFTQHSEYFCLSLSALVIMNIEVNKTKCLFSCNVYYFMRETDDGQAHLGFCCFAFLQRSKFQKLLSNHKYLLTIILGH